MYDAFRCNKYLYKCKGKSFDTFPMKVIRNVMFPLMLSLVGYARRTFIIPNVIFSQVCASDIHYSQKSAADNLLKNTLVGDHLTYSLNISNETYF